MSIFAFFLAIAGGIAYRWRGMSGDDVPSILKPRIIRRLLVTALVALGLFIATSSIWALLAIPLTFFGIIIGHGSYFPRDAGDTNLDNEVFAFITRLFATPLNQKARFIGMALTGLATTIPVLLIPIIATFFGASIEIALWFGLVGILKAVVYHTIFRDSTEKAEYAWGAVLCGASALI